MDNLLSAVGAIMHWFWQLALINVPVLDIPVAAVLFGLIFIGISLDILVPLVGLGVKADATSLYRSGTGEVKVDKSVQHRR